MYNCEYNSIRITLIFLDREDFSIDTPKTIRQTRTINNIMLWAEHIQDCKKNYNSVKEWCLANDVNPKKYYYWQQRVFDYLKDVKQNPDNQLTRFVELPPPKENATITRSNNTELRVASINVNGISIDIFNTTSTDQLTTILGVVSNVK